MGEKTEPLSLLRPGASPLAPVRAAEEGTSLSEVVESDDEVVLLLPALDEASYFVSR